MTTDPRLELAVEASDKPAETPKRFQRGGPGGPGRPRHGLRSAMLGVMREELTLEAWRSIVRKAVARAQRGDGQARLFLARYVLGSPELAALEHDALRGAPTHVVIREVIVNLQTPGDEEGEAGPAMTETIRIREPAVLADRPASKPRSAAHQPHPPETVEDVKAPLPEASPAPKKAAINIASSGEFRLLEEHPASKLSGVGTLARPTRGAPGKRAKLRMPAAGGNGAAAPKRRPPLSLEETLEILGAGELKLQDGRQDPLNDSGVRHLRMEAMKGPRASRFSKLMERLSDRFGGG